MRFLWATLAAAALLPAAADARTLYWRELDVQARLDADGRLRVTESQTMVFSGAWNGGERVFRSWLGQTLELHGMRRVDPASGRSYPMTEGDLARVDHYDFVKRGTLRWRSRLPTDPEFDETAITYVLEYSIGGVLQEAGEHYRLSHDFAFTDRYGDIESFSLVLEVDPVWNDGQPLVFREQRSDLPPGSGVVFTHLFRHAGDERPEAALRQVPKSTRMTIVAAALALALLQLFRWASFEGDQGRYASDEVPTKLNEGWLRDHLFSLKPEEAGAIWDQKIGAPEVAAVIARMVSEEKLSSSVREEGRWFKTQVLELELLVDRNELSGYERRLVDKLFFSGRTQTDTEAVRKRYSSTGFSPRTLIDKPIRKAIRELPGFGKPLAAPNRVVTALLILGGLACFALEPVTRGMLTIGPMLAVLFVWVVVPMAIAYLCAYRYRRRADRLIGAAISWLVPAGALLGVPLFFVFAGHLGFGPLNLGLWGQLALVLIPLAFFNSIVNMARTRDSIGAVAMRRRLAAVRRLFRRELRRESPRLRDSWFAYLMAFGLQDDVDRWFGSYGGGSDSTFYPRRGFGGSSGGGWTGGGGAFGGAGATAAWSAAATSMASGVAKPSSGGGSSGGFSGGSSGGGGGGGW